MATRGRLPRGAKRLDRGFRAGMFPSGKPFPRIRAVSVATHESGGNPVGKPDPGVASRDQRAEQRGVPRETAPFPRLTALARMSFRVTRPAAVGENGTAARHIVDVNDASSLGVGS
jgi:hypothetical protein